MEGETPLQGKRKSGKRILFSPESQCLRSLLPMLAHSSHRALVLWALDCAQTALTAFEAERPDEPRPRIALEKCKAWSSGEIKMPEAKRAILAAHAAAKEESDHRLASLAHAVGQAGSTVHVGTHAPGLVFYELTAVALGAGEERESALAEKIEFYTRRLSYWQERADDPGRDWAAFLQDRTK